MDETQIPERRTTGWTVLLASVLMAFLLTIFVVQGLAAQSGADEDGTPVAPIENGAEGEDTGTMPLDGQDPDGAAELAGGESITGTETLTGSVASTTSSTQTLYFPLFATPLPALAISGTQPNSSNQWQIQWQEFGPDYSYQIQESQWPDFSHLTMDEVVTGTSIDISHAASPWNTYYYRVKAVGKTLPGPWSERLTVVGAYYDDFSDDSTGWAMRRTTFLEQTPSWYGTGSEAGNFIIVVGDRWDWMIASPLQAAPKPPYVIEYRSRVHDASNLVSGGVVLGGDWNFDACPEFGNVYQTDNCFNHFYNFNYIHYGSMKLLFEQIDQLYWCPTCGGSPIKRLGNENNWKEIDPIFGNATARDWHTYRIEVRDSGLYLTIDGQYKGQFGTPAYVNEPFFGVFASTDEYKPSIWFFDYFKVTPLDS